MRERCATIWTDLWLVTAELSVRIRESLQTNRELNVTTADDVLNFELRELGIEAQLLHDPSVLSGRQARVVLGLCTGHDHLARSEDERGGLGLANTHNDSCKTL